MPLPPPASPAAAGRRSSPGAEESLLPHAASATAPAKKERQGHSGAESDRAHGESPRSRGSGASSSRCDLTVARPARNRTLVLGPLAHAPAPANLQKLAHGRTVSATSACRAAQAIPSTAAAALSAPPSGPLARADLLGPRAVAVVLEQRRGRPSGSCAARRNRPGHGQPGAGPGDPLGVLGHVADRRRDEQGPAESRAPGRWCRGRRGRRRGRRPPSPASRRASRRAVRSPARRSAASGRWPLVVATTRTGSSASPSKARRIRSQSGSWAVLEATSTSGSSPWRQLDVGVRELELERPGDDRPRPATRAGTRAAGRCRRSRGGR